MLGLSEAATRRPSREITMAEFWKSIQDKLGKATPAIPEPLTFRERLEREQERQREQIKRQASVGTNSPLAPGESVADANLQDKRVLISMLGWKLDIKKETGEITTNPAKVEGFWLGVKRYWRFARNEDEHDELSWKLHYYRTCIHCKAQIPTIELGDYLEIKGAAEKMMTEGQEVLVVKSTARLAAYLNDLDAGKPDAHCPRMCPKCRKLIKGGTL
jgi:hypothetical protein